MNRAPLWMLGLLLASCSAVVHSGQPSALPQAQGDAPFRAIPAVRYMRGGAALQALDATGAGKIEHVVFIVQENRSFDNLFQGFPHADTVSSGKDSRGDKVPLQPVSLSTKYILDHTAAAMFTDCRGTGSLPGTKCRMDGFNLEQYIGRPKGVKLPMYVYVPGKETRPYFDMAHEWVLSDRTFQSQLDESFVAHQYVIAGQAASSVNVPFGLIWGCNRASAELISTILKNRQPGPQVPACFNYRTLGDELDDAGLPWRFYAGAYGDRTKGDGGEWSAYQAVKHIRFGTDWKKDVVTPNWEFITDVRAGKLAAFTWITPVCSDSDHGDCGGGYGPSWVAALVNTIGKSEFWSTTAIFVIWDDWGGLYDHVPAPYKDYDGLGFRVPLLVISPYAKKDYVAHRQYETASVLRFAEDLFGLKPLSAADRRAESPAAECFDFRQQPRKFVEIAAPYPPRFFMRTLPNDYFAPDYE